jgi:NAD(P)-dependent dehydrogenase (short-subunit alcohol dehydrogenase family)
LTKPLLGRLALVTGASRGIGAATAKGLGAAGAHVVLTARTEGGLAEVEDAIHATGGTATIAPLDLTDGEAVDRLAQAIGGRWNQLDILVLNAAMLGDLSPLPHMPPKQFERIMALNVTAQWRLLRAADPLLRASPWGRVIGVTSSVARNPRAYWGPYAASKAALETLIATYGEEVKNLSPIRTAILNPGATRTAMRASAFPGENPDTVKPPEDIAEMVVQLLIEDFETGARFEGGQRVNA